MIDTKMTICVIDDSKVFASFLMQKLKEQNHNIDFIIFNSPLEFLNEINNKDIDIFLVDYEMPIMTGIKVIEEIRKNKQYMHVPALLLTSGSDNKDKMEKLALQSLEVGANDFLIKESHPKIFYNKIFNFIIQKQLVDNKIEDSQKEVVNALIATTKHEINNALCIAMAFTQKVSKSDIENKFSKETGKIIEAQNRIVKVIKALDDVSNIVLKKGDGKTMYLEIDGDVETGYKNKKGDK